MCMVLALCLMTSWMYFETAKMPSAYAITCEKEPLSGCLTDGSVSQKMEVCTGKMLGICENAGTQQQHIHSQQRREEIEISFAVLCQQFFWPGNGKPHIFLEEAERLLGSQRVSVTNYIHKADGKKRI